MSHDKKSVKKFSDEKSFLSILRRSRKAKPKIPVADGIPLSSDASKAGANVPKQMAKLSKEKSKKISREKSKKVSREKSRKVSNERANASDEKQSGSLDTVSKDLAKKEKAQRLSSVYAKLDCWHGVLPDEDTTDMLREDGEFLVRNTNGYEISRIYLSIRWANEILNISIVTHSDGTYEIEEDRFNSLKELIDYYQVRKMPLLCKGDRNPILGAPVIRKNWELRHTMISLDAELGSGAYGVVYSGTLQKGSDKPMIVAIKELTEMGFKASNALWREARVMREYIHPNVLRLYGVANDYLPFRLVMELVKGGSVDSYFKQMDAECKNVPIKRRINIIYQAALGLEYLHTKNCLHRDIACRNLLIDLRLPTVKVSDFGMSRRASNYRIDPNKPLNLRWLAPEVYTTAIVKKSTDVYAFGVTMYECFTIPYTIPYRDWKPIQIYNKVVNHGYRLKPPTAMPRELRELMTECLGREESRPSFKTVVLCIRSHINNPSE